jgi:hypothetical protein
MIRMEDGVVLLRDGPAVGPEINQDRKCYKDCSGGCCAFSAYINESKVCVTVSSARRRELEEENFGSYQQCTEKCRS